LILGVVDGGLDPTRRLLVGAALLVLAAAALLGRHAVCRWLYVCPWLVLPLAAAQIAAAAIDGVIPAGPYLVFSLMSVGLAVVVARPRTVWLTVAVLEVSYALAVVVEQAPAEFVTNGNLSGVAGTVLGYPCLALVGLGLVRAFVRFMDTADVGLQTLRDGEPALTPALSRAIQGSAIEDPAIEDPAIEDPAIEGSAQLQLPPAPPRLTAMERKVVEGLAEGYAPKELARTWGLKLSTVRTHIRNAKRKTGARTVPELSGLARRDDWADPDRR